VRRSAAWPLGRGGRRAGCSGWRLSSGPPRSRQPAAGGWRLSSGPPRSRQPAGGGWRLSSGPPRSRRAAGSCAAPRTAAADSSHTRHSRHACGVLLRRRLTLPPFLSWFHHWYFSSVRLLEYLCALSLLSFPRALPSCFSRTAAHPPALQPPKIGRRAFFPPAGAFFSCQTGRPCPGRTTNRDWSSTNQTTSFLVELIASMPQIGH
jgi:hypothetical protein